LFLALTVGCVHAVHCADAPAAVVLDDASITVIDATDASPAEPVTPSTRRSDPSGDRAEGAIFSPFVKQPADGVLIPEDSPWAPWKIFLAALTSAAAIAGFLALLRALRT